VFPSQVCSWFFERRLWCRHLCPIGGMNGMFAKLSMTELRARQGVCSGMNASRLLACLFECASRLLARPCPHLYICCCILATMYTSLNA